MFARVHITIYLCKLYAIDKEQTPASSYVCKKQNPNSLKAVPNRGCL